MSHRLVTAIVAAAGAAAAAAAIAIVPPSEPLYFHLDNAREWLATGRITGHHAVGYALVLAPAQAAGGSAGILALHSLMLVAIGVLAVTLLRAAGLGPRACLIGASPVALHPLFVANVTKVSDTNLSVVLLLAIVWLLTAVRRRGGSSARFAAAVGLMAAVFLVRPNLALLFVMLPVVDRQPLARRAGWAAAAAVAVLAAFSVNAATTGHWRLTDPYYSAYTFHNGTNPRAAGLILRDTIGEYSTYRVLEDEGIDYLTTPKAELAVIYWRLGFEFIREQPLAYARLVAVKALNFVRPYYAGGEAGRFGGAALVVQTLAALPLPIWLVVRWRTRGRVPRGGALLAIWIVPLYVLPFLLFNSEPRYRWPLDALLLLEVAVLWQTVRRSTHVLDSRTNRTVHHRREGRPWRHGRALPRPRPGARARRRAQDDAHRLHDRRARARAVPA